MDCDIFEHMKTLVLVIFLTGISACCDTKYDVSVIPAGITVGLKYGTGPNEFAADDTAFYIRFVNDKTGNSTADSINLRPDPATGASAIFFPVSIYNKFIISSFRSDYKDTLFDIKVQSREKHLGPKRCNNVINEFFGIECVYNGKKFIDPEQGTMFIPLER